MLSGGINEVKASMEFFKGKIADASYEYGYFSIYGQVPISSYFCSFQCSRYRTVSDDSCARDGC